MGQPVEQRLAEVLQALLDVVLTLAHHRPRFHPGREDIGHIQRINEVAVGAITRMRRTRSISVKPGSCTSQRSVFSGI